MQHRGNELISVIVPIYNAGAYLNACVDSILVQSYRELEVILVDDGSTDGSQDICDDYAAADGRVRVIHQANGGEASARNAGLMAASGDYVGFVDSDDTVAPEMFQTLIKTAVENRCDVVICGHWYCEPNGWQHAADAAPQSGILEREAALFYLLQGGSYEGYVWNKLFKRHLFDGVRFSNDIRYCEDLLTVCKLFLLSGRIWYLAEALYYYNIRAGSLTGQFTEKRLTEFVAREQIVSLMEPTGTRLYQYAKSCYCRAAIYQMRCAARAGNRQCVKILRRYAGKYWKTYWTSEDILLRDKLKSAVVWIAPGLVDRLWRDTKARMKITYNRQMAWGRGEFGGR